MVSFVHPGRVYPPKHVLVLGNTRHSLLRSCSVLYHTLHNLQVARVISFHLLTYGTDTCGTTSVTLFFSLFEAWKVVSHLVGAVLWDYVHHHAGGVRYFIVT